MRKKLLAAVIAMTMLFSGCMTDVKSYLQPPRAQGQQQAVQDALEAAITSGGETAYILKYPVAGSISSAFVLLDDAGNPADTDNAVTAVAFYAPGSGKNTHIHLLHRKTDGWTSVADTVGEGTDIDRVLLGDLNGDGMNELLVGWSLYSSDCQLSIYRLHDSTLATTPDAGRYTDCFVGDMNADGCDEAVLLHIGGTAAVTATLVSWTAEAVTVRGTARLDGSIRSFEKLLYGKASNGADALYIDAVRDNGSYITEMLCFDGNKLVAPLYNAATDRTTVSARVAHVSVMDADGNGVPEFPVTSRQAGNATAAAENTWQWITEWYSWDMHTAAPVRQFASVVDRTDGYFIELEDSWIATLYAYYDTAAATLWLNMRTENGENKPFLAVQNTATAQKSAPEGYTFSPLSKDSPLSIWYDSSDAYHLNAEKISYMLVTFS